jgi:formylglycine-generating enzyme required for sulfatase activity
VHDSTPSRTVQVVKEAEVPAPGASEELLPRYAWVENNARNRAWPGGQKRPNDLGLFDMHGNAWNWCLEPYVPYPASSGDAIPDKENLAPILSMNSRVLRGGSFASPTPIARSA